MATFDIIAGPKRSLDTIQIVAKRRIFVTFNIFTTLIVASYYILEEPERPIDNYYYCTYLPNGVIYLRRVIFIYFGFIYSYIR